MSAEQIDLLPCPFCGGEAEISEWEDGNYPTMSAMVECDCGIKGKICGANNRLGCFDAENGLHRSRAIAAWNRRASPVITALAEDAARAHDLALENARLREALYNIAHEVRFLLRLKPSFDGGLYRKRLDEADAVLSSSAPPHTDTHASSAAVLSARDSIPEEPK